MKVRCEAKSVNKRRRYPYLAYDDKNNLVLVGLYSIISLNPHENGNGYVKIGEGIFKPADGITVTLENDFSGDENERHNP